MRNPHSGQIITSSWLELEKVMKGEVIEEVRASPYAVLIRFASGKFVYLTPQDPDHNDGQSGIEFERPPSMGELYLSGVISMEECEAVRADELRHFWARLKADYEHLKPMFDKLTDTTSEASPS